MPVTLACWFSLAGCRTGVGPGGRRHRLAAILALAVAAVAAGAKSLTAIAEWAAAAPGWVLAAVRVRRDPRTGSLVVPSETTIRRTLGKADADALNAQVGAWLLAVGFGGEQDPGEQMVVSVDGKTARGARPPGGTAPHFLGRDHLRRDRVLPAVLKMPISEAL